MPKPSAPAVKLSAAEPGKIEIKTSPGQLCLVRLYGLAQEKRETCVYIRMSRNLRTPSWGTSNYAFLHAESGSGLDLSPNLAMALCEVFEKGPSRTFFESNCFFVLN